MLLSETCSHMLNRCISTKLVSTQVKNQKLSKTVSTQKRVSAQSGTDYHLAELFKTPVVIKS